MKRAQIAKSFLSDIYLMSDSVKHLIRLNPLRHDQHWPHTTCHILYLAQVGESFLGPYTLGLLSLIGVETRPCPFIRLDVDMDEMA